MCIGVTCATTGTYVNEIERYTWVLFDYERRPYNYDWQQRYLERVPDRLIGDIVDKYTQGVSIIEDRRASGMQGDTP
jgi:hypothetical protein